MPHSRSHKTHRRSRSKSHKTHRRHRRSTSRKMRRCPRGSKKTCRKISRKTRRSSHRKRGGSGVGEWWKTKRQSWENARQVKKLTMGDETLGKALKADVTKAATTIKGVPGKVATAIGDAAATFGKNVAQKATDTAKAIQELPCDARKAKFKKLLDCLQDNNDDSVKIKKALAAFAREFPPELLGGKRRSHSKKSRKSRKTRKSRKSRRCPRGSIRHSRKRSRRGRKSRKHSRKSKKHSRRSRKSKKHSRRGRKSRKHSRRH